MLIDRRGFVGTGAAATAASYLGLLANGGQCRETPSRPQWELTTSDSYDPWSVAPY